MLAIGLATVRTVFMDRDGTLNVKPPDGEYITSPDDLVMIAGAARAVAQLNASGLRTVLVTNQRWLSGPAGDAACFAEVQARLHQLLAAEGAWLDASYHCPHALDSCDCRKPAPGMLRRAATDHQFDLLRAVIVGDSDADVEAGRSVGAATILLRADASDISADADAVAADLPAAVRIILQAVGRRTGPKRMAK